MATRNELLRERVELVAEIKRIQVSEGVELAKLDSGYIKIKKRLSEILTTLKKASDSSNEMLSSMIDTTKTASELSGVYGGMKSHLQSQLTLQRNIADSIALQSIESDNALSSTVTQGNVISDTIQSYSRLSSLASQLSQLTDEDVLKRVELENSMTTERSLLNDHINKLDEKQEITGKFLILNDSLAKSIERQSDRAMELSQLTADTKNSMGGMVDIYDDVTARADEQLGKVISISTEMERQKQLGENVIPSDAVNQIQSILDGYFDMYTMTEKLSSLNLEDVGTRNEILSSLSDQQSSIQEQLSLLDTRNDIVAQFLTTNDDLSQSVKVQIDEARALSGMTVEQRDNLQSIGTVHESITDELKLQTQLQAQAVGSIDAYTNASTELNSSTKSQREILDGILTTYGEVSRVALELSQLSIEDEVQRQQLLTDLDSQKTSISEQVGLLDGRNESSKVFLANQTSLNKSIDKQIQQAENLSSLSKKEKEILEGQAETYDLIRGKIDSIGSTLTTFLKRPQAAIGAAVIGFGAMVNKVGAVNKELGLTIFETNKASLSAGALSLFFDDTAGTVKALTNEFGTLDSATFGAQLNVGLMASNMGISNTEAATLMGSFARMNGGSTDIASDMIATTKEFAKQNNVIPSDVLSDMAGSAEQFALFAKEGGKNMIEAAVGARQLGTNIGTVGNIAEGLLDFESSITKELELGALLGKNVNLNKARQLAYDGDILGATKETLKQVGGIAAFNKMDYYQKKATADMMGISVAELQKMADNQAKVGEQGQMITETFSKWGSILDGGLSKYLGTSIEGIGGMITMTGELGRGFETLSAGAKGIGGAFSWVKKTMGGVKKVTETASTVADGAKEGMELGKTGKDLVPDGGAGGGLKGLAEGLKEMGSGKVLFGAFNMIPTAAGMIAILPGIPGLFAVGRLGQKAGEGLVSLGEGLDSMGTGKVLFGAVNLIPTAIGMAIMTAGIGGLFAVSKFGEGAGEGLVNLGEGLESMGTGKVLFGSANLIVAGAGMAIMTAGIGGMAIVAGLGKLAGKGLGGLADGLSKLGSPKVILGSVALILLAGGLTLMGYAMGLFAENASGILPAIGALVAFGLAAALIGSFVPLILLGSVGIAALGASLIIFGLGIQSISNGLTPVLTVLSNMTDTVGSLITLGVGLFSLAGGLMALGLAAPFALLATIPLMMLATLGSKLESVSSGFTTVGDGIRSIMESVSMDKIGGLFLLGPALLSASVGLGVFSLAMLAASAGDGLSSMFGGGIMDTLTELSGLSPQLTLVATALTTIATSIGLLVASLGGLNIEKLNELTNIDISNLTSKLQDPSESISRIQEVDVTEKVNKVNEPTESISKLQDPSESISRIQEVDVTEKVNKVNEPTESISKLQEPEQLGKQDVSIPTSITTDISDITNSIPDTLLTTLTSISDMAPNISLTSVALSSMGSALGLIATNLESISTEKLNSLSDFSMSASIGSTVSGIADTISGVLGTVTGVVQGETLSEYETQMMQKMDQLIQAVNTGRDVYMDKEKVTNVVMKMTERSSKNMFGLENA